MKEFQRSPVGLDACFRRKEGRFPGGRAGEGYIVMEGFLLIKPLVQATGEKRREVKRLGGNSSTGSIALRERGGP